MWGDKVLVRPGSQQRRHDQVRDVLAKACRGIRRFNGHTELRVGLNLYVDLTVFDGLGDATFANPLDLDVHIHHFYGQDWTERNRSSCRSTVRLRHADNFKVAKYKSV